MKKEFYPIFDIITICTTGLFVEVRFEGRIYWDSRSEAWLEGVEPLYMWLDWDTNGMIRVFFQV